MKTWQVSLALPPLPWSLLCSPGLSSMSGDQGPDFTNFLTFSIRLGCQHKDMGMPQSPWPWNPVKKKFESIPRNNDDIDDMMKLIMMLMTVKFPWRTWFLASSCLGWETGPAMEAASVTVGGWNRKIARFLTCWILLLALGFQLPNLLKKSKIIRTFDCSGGHCWLNRNLAYLKTFFGSEGCLKPCHPSSS